MKCCAAGDVTKYYPEYESARRIAEEGGLPLADAYRLIREAAEER